jgi:hypothetical protein|tara:strand:- start:775 stop:987 length:213 start_codon:yes stop_codon:yes gene_type:complete
MMTQPIEVPSVEYKKAMFSVNLITEIVNSGDTDEATLRIKEQNQTHLVVILAKDFWTNEDLTPLQNAVDL